MTSSGRTKHGRIRSYNRSSSTIGVGKKREMGIVATMGGTATRNWISIQKWGRFCGREYARELVRWRLEPQADE